MQSAQNKGALRTQNIENVNIFFSSLRISLRSLRETFSYKCDVKCS